MKTIITTNAHDHGFDLVLGTDITGRVIGRIWWEAPDPGSAGLVLRFDRDPKTYPETHLPDSASEAVSILQDVGYDLTPESIDDIERLIVEHA